MAGLGLPVPPGFTITGGLHPLLRARPALPEALGPGRPAGRAIEQIVGCGFRRPGEPLLVSVRSGARSSMPGMMETVLNVGLTSAAIRA